MTATPLDPMAGITATRIRRHPDQPHPIADPTDPRYGHLPLHPGDRRPLTDPTDPRNGAAD